MDRNTEVNKRTGRTEIMPTMTLEEMEHEQSNGDSNPDSERSQDQMPSTLSNQISRLPMYTRWDMTARVIFPKGKS